MAENSDADYCRRMPKTELHAHLTGSVLPSCLREIWKEKKAADPTFELDDPVQVLETARKGMDADKFFPLFSSFIYKLCDSKPYVQMITEQVLADFYNDGVTYLELRTIPRPTPDMTKDEYVQVVLETIRTANVKPAAVYLILGVDRKNTPEEAMDTIELAIKYKDQGVVAVDLCGNPKKGVVNGYGPAYKKAKEAGLKLTLHFAEVEFSSQDEELRWLLDYQPDRLGHVINVPDWAKKIIEERKLGLELCLTCNVSAKLIKGGFETHHFGYWWGRKTCPVAICTDDVGIFGSKTSEEYLMLMKHFNLTKKEIVDVAMNSIDCIFGTEEDKARLKKQFDEFIEKANA